MTDTLVISVRVQPRASRNEIDGVSEGRLKIRTTAAPTDGKANQAVIRQLAQAFGVPPTRISLKSGASSRLKTFVVESPAIIPDWLRDIDFR